MQQQQQEVKLEIKLEEIKSEPIELEVLIEPSPHSPPPTPHKPYPLAISPATPATPEIPTSTHQHQTTSNYRHVKTCRVCGDVAFCKHQSLFGYSSHFVILSFVSFAKWNSIQLQWYQLRILSVCVGSPNHLFQLITVYLLLILLGTFFDATQTVTPS